MNPHDYIDFQARIDPLAYLITVRTYGTWLHGDRRGSVERSKFSRFGKPRRPWNPALEASENEHLRHPPVIFEARQRITVEQAIREVCLHRGYQLLGINVRSNHVHSVVSAPIRPETIMNAFKAYATRHLRIAGLIGPDVKPWSRHGSTVYIWTSEQVERAIDYVVARQESPFFLKDTGNMT